MLALGGCEPDPTQFPCICHWLELVNGYSAQEQARYVDNPRGAMEARWTSNSKVVGSSPIGGSDIFSHFC